MNAAGICLVLGALAGGTGVMFGAFGAHALRAQLGADAIQTWQTAVLYQLVHALALIGTGLWLRIATDGGAAPDRLVLVAGAAFALGVLLFSGSLYALALGGPRWLGPVTPLGGLAFLVGWFVLAAAALRSSGGS